MSDSDDSSWSDVSEASIEVENCLSLFTADKYFPSASECFAWDAQQHNFDFFSFRRSNELDFYGCVKVINYIRSNAGIPASEIVAILNSGSREWDDDRYLTPAIENDALLFGFDDGAVSDDDEDISNLATENEAMKSEIIQMRAAFRNALDIVEQSNDKSVDKAAEIAEHDKSYFAGYGTTDIHEIMLRDKERTLAYQSFCNNNKNLFADKVVLDIGCGSGILCLFAAQAGAKRVIGIDNADIIHKARRVVERNGYGNVIELLQGKVEDIKLDCKVDLIISEWMGYFLLFESMLSTVLVARDRFLIDKTKVFPDRATLYVMGVETKSFCNQGASFWKDVYGFDLTDVYEPNKNLELFRHNRRACIEHLPQDAICTNTSVIRQIDVSTVSDSDLDFSSEFTLYVKRDECLDAIASYFTVDFEGDCEFPVRLSTSCTDPFTHWQQTLFMLASPVPVRAGDVITGRIRACRPSNAPRDYDIVLDVSINGTPLAPMCYSLS
uniref:type I protein arginine methyltransferase n=1 Tax=Spongospora subterranea TaxID=70186 RepID=A0A0H5QXQ4_9EUKA|eukprot:CRZ06521.1 hypothetical protein [Spongospora subterranea]